MRDDKHGPILDNVDPGKREFIGELIKTTAFAAPVVASFSLSGITNADAQVANGSHSFT